jgi:hypothetical protein
MLALHHRGRRKKEPDMKSKLKGASLVVLVPALALAAPAFAQTTPPPTPVLDDSQEPGSVIVFPKFINAPAVTLPEGGTAPVTEIEIGVVCPKGDVCAEHQPVKIRFHWVCGTTEAAAATSFVCPEVDFDVTATVYEKIVLVPDGTPQNGYVSGLPTKTVPPAPCPAGYLIGWVINPANDQPVKFDGLIGDASLRPGNVASNAPGAAAPVGSPTALATYDAIPVQAANAAQATFNGTNGAAAAITTNANGALLFDGLNSDYAALTGQVMGDIRYTNLGTGPTFTLGAITLLTLDVKSNRPNNPVFVDVDFFGGNPSAIGNENVLSTSTEFICWGELPLTALAGGDLTTTLMGRKGVFVSDQAVKIQFGGITDESGPTTLLGLAEVMEGGVFPPVAPWPRAAFTGLYNSSSPVPTHFLPTPAPILLP